MTWQVRRQGSPAITTGLTSQQVLEGVKDGVWDVTDEVKGPNDVAWQPLESHPIFEEAIAEIEMAAPRHHDVEEHLDMNPLIDVALVLLIFFILTTSYDQLRKVIDMPTMSRNSKGIKVLDESQAKSEFVIVNATLGPDKKVIYKVDNQEVPEQHLRTAIEVGVAQGRSKMIIDVSDVSWQTVMNIIDAGKQARVVKFMMRVPGEPGSAQ